MSRVSVYAWVQVCARDLDLGNERFNLESRHEREFQGIVPNSKDNSGRALQTNPGVVDFSYDMIEPACQIEHVRKPSAGNRRRQTND